MSNDCVFCKIVKKELDSNIIAESDLCLAIADIEPKTKGHTLVIPKKHFENLMLTDDDYLKDAIVLAKEVAKKLKSTYPDIKAFNYLSNQGAAAKPRQVVFHLHIHVIPRY